MRAARAARCVAAAASRAATCSASAKACSSSASSRVLPANAGSSHASSVCSERSVGQVRQREFRHPAAQALHARAPLPQRLAPRQRLEAERAHRIGQRAGRLRGIDATGRPAVEHDAVEALHALGHQRASRRIPSHFVAVRRNARRSRCANVARPPARRAGSARPWFRSAVRWRRATVRRTGRCRRTAARCGRWPAGSGAGRSRGWRAMRSGNACASRSPSWCGAASLRRTRVDAQAASPLRGGGVDGGERGAAGLRRHAPVAKRGQRLPARGQRIGAQPALRTQRVARFDQRGEIAGQRAFAEVVRRQQHRGQARMRAEREHAAAERRDRVAIECAEPAQQVARRRQRAGWRRIDEAQVGIAPRGEFQRQRGQFDLRDLGPPLRLQSLRRRPQAIRPAAGDTAGAAGALVGRGLRDADDVEPREAASSGRSAARARVRCR